jgi:hypothetical protein
MKLAKYFKQLMTLKMRESVSPVYHKHVSCGPNVRELRAHKCSYMGYCRYRTFIQDTVHCWSYKMQHKSKCWSRPIHKTPRCWFSYMNYTATACKLEICLPLSTRVAQHCVKLHCHCFVIKGSRVIQPQHFLADCTKLYNVYVYTYIYIYIYIYGYRRTTFHKEHLCLMWRELLVRYEEPSGCGWQRRPAGGWHQRVRWISSRIYSTTGGLPADVIERQYNVPRHIKPVTILKQLRVNSYDLFRCVLCVKIKKNNPQTRLQISEHPVTATWFGFQFCHLNTDGLHFSLCLIVYNLKMAESEPKHVAGIGV